MLSHEQVFIFFLLWDKRSPWDSGFKGLASGRTRGEAGVNEKASQFWAGM